MEGARESARLLGRKPGTVEDPDDLVDEFALPLRKLEALFSLQLSLNASVDFRRRERSELFDNSTKLADAQEHPVVLEVRDGHDWQTVPVAWGHETVRAQQRDEYEGARR